MARKQGIKVGLFRPITLWPFPKKQISKLAHQLKGILVVEINAGQMIFDVRCAVEGKIPAEHYGLKVNRNGMACCPFHNDRHPSLKLNEEYFFCFGCGAKGDVIDFAAQSLR